METPNIFCSRCGQSREGKNAHKIVLEGGQPAKEGDCATCGAKLVHVLFRQACQ